MTPRTAHRAFAIFPAIPAALLLLTAALSPRPAAAQSFDCHAAHYPDEETICQHQALGRLDEELARRYQQAGDKLDKGQRAAFEQHEDMFVRARRRCGANIGCIAQSYRNRIGELENMMSTDEGDEDSSTTADKDDARDRPKHGAKNEARSERRPHRPEERAKTETKKVETTATENSGSGAGAEKSDRLPTGNGVNRPPNFATLAPAPAAEPVEPKLKTKRTAERPAKHNHHQAAATPSPAAETQTGTSAPTASAPTPQAETRAQAEVRPRVSSNPSAPTIHWVDPPPGR